MYENSPNQAYVYFLIVFLPGTCLFLILAIRRYKKHFLSKDSFNISMK